MLTVAAMEGGVWIVGSSFEERAKPKAAGAWWHPGLGCGRDRCAACRAGIGKSWWTREKTVAARLLADGAQADDTTRTGLAAVEATRQASRAVTADIAIPAPEGREFLPFQRAGIAFALARFGFDFSLDLPYNGTRQVPHGGRDAKRNLQAQSGTDGSSPEKSGQGQGTTSTTKSTRDAEQNHGDSGMEAASKRSDKASTLDTGYPTQASSRHGTGAQTAWNQLPGGQRSADDGNRCGMGAATDSSRVHPGICDQNERAEYGRADTTELQGGLRESTNQDSHRIGRPNAPPSSIATFAGREKDPRLRNARMEGNPDSPQMKGGANPSCGGGVIFADEMG